MTDGAPSAKQLRAISLPIAGATVIELTVLGMYADSENILYTFARQITDVNASERYGSGAMFITDFSGT